MQEPARHRRAAHRLPLPTALAPIAGLALTLACGSALAAGKAHEHGALKLDIGIDGRALSIALDVPLDNLLGFERAPRNDAERRAATELLARLRAPGQGPALFITEAAAQCTLTQAEVDAPVLAPGAQAAAGAHADLEASYTYSCAQPGALRSLEIGLFQAFSRLQRIDVQVAGPQGQSKATLKRPQRRLALKR